jgi:hypothetical protein
MPGAILSSPAALDIAVDLMRARVQAGEATLQSEMKLAERRQP